MPKELPDGAVYTPFITPYRKVTMLYICGHAGDKALPKEVSEANRANCDGFMTAMYNGWVERLTKLQNEKGSFSENEWETAFKRVVQDWHAAGKKW